MGVTCQYCKGPAELVPDTEIHRRSYGGKVWVCTPCQAHVGCWPKSETPRGTLAKLPLRRLRIKAHFLFDGLWKGASKIRKESKQKTRTLGYLWLAHQLRIHPDNCHLGMLNDADVQRVIEACLPFYDRMPHVLYEALKRTYKEGIDGC